MYIAVFITVPKKNQARRIARAIIRNKLAACVNIVLRIESFFWWQGKIDKADEVLLIVKTQKSKFPKLAKFVASMHSYEIPEIIALEISAGNRAYLKWIDDSLG